MPFQLMDIPRWFLINMLLRFGFSRCLQALVHWCGFHAARVESEWCIGLYCQGIIYTPKGGGTPLQSSGHTPNLDTPNGLVCTLHPHWRVALFFYLCIRVL